MIVLQVQVKIAWMSQSMNTTSEAKLHVTEQTVMLNVDNVTIELYNCLMNSITR